MCSGLRIVHGMSKVEARAHGYSVDDPRSTKRYVDCFAALLMLAARVGKARTPTEESRARPPEQGSALVIILVMMVGLLAVAGSAANSVRSSLAAGTFDRFHSMALAAAESGIAAGMHFLRESFDSTQRWTALVSPANDTPLTPTGIIGNDAEPGNPGNPFSTPFLASYTVSVLNNASDPGFVEGTDSDARIILRSVGHGPDGALVILEAEIAGGGLATSATCSSYGQEGQSESGSGRQDCLGVVSGSSVSFSPGGS
jgi:hypothetical protein